MENVVSVRFGDWISEGWRMFVEQWQVWVLDALIVFGILLLPLAPIVIFAFIAMSMAQGSPDAAFGALAGIFGLEGLAVLIVAVVGSYFSAGLHRSALKQLRGERIQVSDLFSGGDCFFRVLGAALLMGILISMGYVLCIVPGIIVAGLLFFTQFLIVDQRLGIIEAMQKSYELCRKNMWWFALFALVVNFLSQAGSYACYVGLLATYPLLFTIGAVAYRDSFDIPGMRYFRDKGAAGAALYNPAQASFMPPPAAPEPKSFMPPPYPPQGTGPEPPQQTYPPAPPQQPYSPTTPQQPYSPTTPPSFMPPQDVAPSAVPQPATPEPPSPNTGNVEVPNPGIPSCPSCRAPLTPAARFCPKCGTPVTGSAGPGSANA